MTIESPSAAAYGALEPLLAWQAALFEGLTQAQSFQLEWLSAWQRMFPVTQELWDEWIAHFGGGVPLDA